jgi:multiple sugar transport system permease protein
MDRERAPRRARRVSLLPLAWMLSVSFMAPGEAPRCRRPPAVAPTSATIASSSRASAWARYVVNSLAIATALTARRSLFNVMAGYAFAKLRIRGRERIFRWLVGALLIPAQVAMMPLFLLLKSWAS